MTGRANGPYGRTIYVAHWQFDGDMIFPLPTAQPDMHGWKNLLEAAAWESQQSRLDPYGRARMLSVSACSDLERLPREE
jgi:L-aminopeptidase/D-esterase-like protein